MPTDNTCCICQTWLAEVLQKSRLLRSLLDTGGGYRLTVAGVNQLFEMLPRLRHLYLGNARWRVSSAIRLSLLMPLLTSSYISPALRSETVPLSGDQMGLMPRRMRLCARNRRGEYSRDIRDYLRALQCVQGAR
jgi:hypothetical protein